MNRRDLVVVANAARRSDADKGEKPPEIGVDDTELEVAAARAAFGQPTPRRARSRPAADADHDRAPIDLLVSARRYGETGLADADRILIEKRREQFAPKEFIEEVGAVSPFVKRSGATLRPDDRGLTRFTDSSTADTFSVDFEVTPRPGYPRVDNAYSKLYFASAIYDADWVLASKGAVAGIAVNVDFQHYLMGAGGNDDFWESDYYDDWAFAGVGYSLAIYHWSQGTGVTRIGGTLPDVLASSPFFNTSYQTHVSNAQNRPQDPRIPYAGPQWRMIPDLNLYVDRTYSGSPILVSKGAGIYVRLGLIVYLQAYGDRAGAMFRTSMWRPDGSILSGGKAVVNPARVYLDVP